MTRKWDARLTFYDEVGNLQHFTYPNGVTTSHSYDALNRLTNLTANKVLNPLASYTYTLAPTGHRLAVQELNGRVVNYAYDVLHRLTHETVSGAFGQNGTVHYDYDAVGNRLARNSTLPGILASTYNYDANDRISATFTMPTATRARPRCARTPLACRLR